jgi:hypothetical protein
MLGIINCINNDNFLLSLKDDSKLLSFWYNTLNPICSKIIIIVSEEYDNIIYNLIGNVIIINSKNKIKNYDYDRCIIVDGNNIVDYIDTNIITKLYDDCEDVIFYWNTIPNAWMFKKELEDMFINNNYDEELFLKENMQGLLWNNYKDYISFLNIPKRTYVKGTLIIVSSYIGNIEREKIDISLNCLKKLRKYYPNEIIIIVDNNSYNQEYVTLAILLKMYVIKNTSELYRFEIGAYNLALKYFKADKYICIQHSIELNSNINEELDMNVPDAYVFSTTKNLSWNDNGLRLINKYLNFVNMSEWNGEPLAIWNSFYCNNLMMEKIIDSGLFNLISNTKDISQAYERIIGTFLFRILNKVNIIESHIYHKNFFMQE